MDNPDIDFEDKYIENEPIVNQLENFIKNNNIDMKKGWKVKFATFVKNHLSTIKQEDTVKDYILIWQELFNKFVSEHN